ncbi:MAG: LLM class flavin-dependent oxidoreductase [Gammaproteobacteria bacterium]|nr:LLM class flavin-dependent oxidoreductase [Gammaproteobacteria bacterium]MBI5616219.1 LLM class flavin-dependent oxidoreductase [Gammaproteobacteria bacterium]
MTKRMIINVFSQCCPTPQSEGQWKNPRDRSVPGFNDPEFWIDLAKTAERGCFDSLFFADVHGAYDVYGGNMDAGIRHGVQVPGNDPSVLLPLLAHETSNLGFIITYSTTYFQPFLTAKMFSSLDHFTNGRVGWNIVTSYLRTAAQNGLGELLEHDARYDKAEEYMEVCYKLWELSWDDDALVFDRVRDMLIDPARVRLVNHKGPHYEVSGPHMCTPTRQRTPFLVQAGQSSRGYEFSSKHAEAVFVVFQNLHKAREGERLVRELEQRYGRARDTVKLMQGIGVVVAETEAEVASKLERCKGYASVEGALALFGGWTGVDLSGFRPGDELGAFESNQMRHLAAFFGDIDPQRRWTFADMCDYMKLCSVCPLIVGTPDRVADALERWVDEGRVDGFNLIPVDQPGSLRDFVDLVVPELQRRGRMRTAYPSGRPTLRELYAGGDGRLAADHPARRVSL